jgi:penicillin-binding protein 1A
MMNNKNPRDGRPRRPPSSGNPQERRSERRHSDDASRRREAAAAKKQRAAAQHAGERKRKLQQLKRRMRVEKRELRKRVSGRPTRSSSVISVPEILLSGIGKIIKYTLIFILIFGFLVLGLGLGMLSGYISTATPLEVVDIRYTNEPTTIVDKNGNTVAILTGAQNVQREYIQIAQIRNTYLEEAIKAIEDERFDSHNGIDPRRIGSAVMSMLVNAGTPTHGGSTITQQVVKMMSGADAESAQRKIQEWYRAVDLEKRMSKDEIMELYINIIPMANNYVGVQAAAKAYFAKDASELDLAESAYLAGIPNLPSIYNPLTDYGKRNGLRRMRITLEKMYDLGWITTDEYVEAMNKELVFRQEAPKITSNQIHSWFVDAAVESVIEDLMTRRGYSRQLAEQVVYQQGLTIELTMDPKVQAAAEASFQKQELFTKNADALPDIPEPPQASITIISNDGPTKGQVVGIVGGYGRKRQNFIFNRATQAHRQPGSSIKPILVYAPAINSGAITAATVLDDKPMYLDRENPNDIYPWNWHLDFEGLVTVRYALSWSINTIAAEIYANILSPQIGLAYLRELGIDRTDETQVAGALGGFSYGMSTYEMAGAYAAFANEGMYIKPYFYTRVLDIDGNVLLENKPEFRQVFSPATAFIMNDILTWAEENVSWHSYSRFDGQMIAGKSGTTNDDIDTWFCGYTPYYTAAVWYGYDNRDGRRTTINFDDKYSPQYIWKDVMEKIHEGLPQKAFEKPDEVVSRFVCRDSGYLATESCPHVIAEWFDATKPNLPNQYCPINHNPSPIPTQPTTTETTDPAATEGTPETSPPETPPEVPPETPPEVLPEEPPAEEVTP